MPTSMGTKHGAVAMGLGSKQVHGGAVGPGGNFMGTKNPQDITRKVSSYSGKNSGPAVPGNVGIKQTGRAGGRNRKFAGVVGTGKATGTK